MLVAKSEAGIAPGIARIAAGEGVAAGLALAVVAISARAVGDRFRHMARRGDEGRELAHRDLMLSEPEAARDANPMGRAFVGECADAAAINGGEGACECLVALRQAHREFARRQRNEAHAQCVGQRLCMGR
jgi:hypothetical protein